MSAIDQNGASQTPPRRLSPGDALYDARRVVAQKARERIRGLRTLKLATIITTPRYRCPERSRALQLVAAITDELVILEAWATWA